jgi:hypothetical protein
MVVAHKFQEYWIVGSLDCWILELVEYWWSNGEIEKWTDGVME